MIESSDKLVPKKPVKRRERVMKKWDRGKVWTKNQDCPSNSGTVGVYAHLLIYPVFNVIV